MKLPERSDVEIMSSPGTLRVTIKSSHFSLALIGIVFLTVVVFSRNFWLVNFHQQPFPAVFIALVVLIPFWQEIARLEVIEFDAQRMVIRKNRVWARTSEYPLANCYMLDTRSLSRNNNNRFICKVARKTITFGQSLNYRQADNILRALQNTLPEIADRLLGNAVPNEHI